MISNKKTQKNKNIPSTENELINSVLIYQRSDDDFPHVTLGETIPHAEGKAMDNFGEIYLAVNNAGYTGAIVDVHKISDNKCLVVTSFNQETAEGRILLKIYEDALCGIANISPRTALKRIREEKNNEHCINNSAKEGG